MYRNILVTRFSSDIVHFKTHSYTGLYFNYVDQTGSIDRRPTQLRKEEKQSYFGMIIVQLLNVNVYSPYLVSPTAEPTNKMGFNTKKWFFCFDVTCHSKE